MSIRLRIYLALLVPVAIGLYYLVTWSQDHLRVRYLESMEESLVDTATVLAGLLSAPEEGPISTAALAAAVAEAKGRTLAARIYAVTKSRVAMRVYVTNARGIVIYDSDDGKALGEDYARWNDVYLTLRGQYGARSTPIDPAEPNRDMLYVAAPVLRGGKVVGVLSVGKPETSIDLFLGSARERIVRAGIVTGLSILVVGTLLAYLITRPLGRLAAYAREIGAGRNPPPPTLGRSEIGRLGEAFEEMREKLEGKKALERHIEGLTHQLKSPIAAISGAAELLEGEADPAVRARRLEDIAAEASRMTRDLDQMRRLVEVERLTSLRETSLVFLADLADQVLVECRGLAAARGVRLIFAGEGGAAVDGNEGLLKIAAHNLVTNAIDFSSSGGTVTLAVGAVGGQAVLAVRDEGAGIPAYALGRIFERHYSLERPDTGRKSSGLGLNLAQEIAELHRGTVRVANRSGGGVEATLALPLARNA